MVTKDITIPAEPVLATGQVQLRYGVRTPMSALKGKAAVEKVILQTRCASSVAYGISSVSEIPEIPVAATVTAEQEEHLTTTEQCASAKGPIDTATSGADCSDNFLTQTAAGKETFPPFFYPTHTANKKRIAITNK